MPYVAPNRRPVNPRPRPPQHAGKGGKKPGGTFMAMSPAMRPILTTTATPKRAF